MSNQVKIFDTTLRDGEQALPASLTVKEKLQIALALERLGVDIIEAGFPVSSPGDFESVQSIAREVKNATVCGLSRALAKDIDACGEALKVADQFRIHTFIATSEIHVGTKLRKSQDEVVEMAVQAVKHARRYTDDVEFSCEDAGRTHIDYLCRMVEAAINAGATTVNIPDTVGYTTPTEFGGIIHNLFNRVPNIDKATISVHCHNDLGLAVANSLAAVEQGARQVECTINGIGERAGNCSLEEIAMILQTRQGMIGLETNINSAEISRTSKLVSQLCNMPVQSNKAIVGANAFSHSSGIHQDGVLKGQNTYEIMTPESVGINKNNLNLTSRSGRHVIKHGIQATTSTHAPGANVHPAVRHALALGIDCRRHVCVDGVLGIFGAVYVVANQTHAVARWWCPGCERCFLGLSILCHARQPDRGLRPTRRRRRAWRRRSQRTTRILLASRNLIRQCHERPAIPRG